MKTTEIPASARYLFAKCWPNACDTYYEDANDPHILYVKIWVRHLPPQFHQYHIPPGGAVWGIGDRDGNGQFHPWK